MMQGQLDALNENIERLIEQVRLANSYGFGKHTETLKSIDGQISFFDEAEALFNAATSEPSAEDVLPKKRTTKKKGQRELDLKEFPEEIIPPYSVSEEELDKFYGKGNWRRMPDETFKRLRHEPESWTVEIHTVEVYVGTDGLQQYHLVAEKLPDVTNANSWAHARRGFADAVKAANKKDADAVRNSVAYQALEKIGEFYNADTELKELSSEERLQKRQEKIRPLVEEFLKWVKKQAAECAVPPKSKTGEALQYVINQENI